MPRTSSRNSSRRSRRALPRYLAERIAYRHLADRRPRHADDHGVPAGASNTADLLHLCRAARPYARCAHLRARGVGVRVRASRSAHRPGLLVGVQPLRRSHRVRDRRDVPGLCGRTRFISPRRREPLAPVRLTGNFGSEVLRGMSHFQAEWPLAPELMAPDFRAQLDASRGPRPRTTANRL